MPPRSSSSTTTMLLASRAARSSLLLLACLALALQASGQTISAPNCSIKNYSWVIRLSLPIITLFFVWIQHLMPSVRTTNRLNQDPCHVAANLELFCSAGGGFPPSCWHMHMPLTSLRRIILYSCPYSWTSLPKARRRVKVATNASATPPSTASFPPAVPARSMIGQSVYFHPFFLAAPHYLFNTQVGDLVLQLHFASCRLDISTVLEYA